MGVPLQLILGILLALAQANTANSPNIRQIREAPPPSPAPIQNVTEINNRDLNKIINTDPKTETVDSKRKSVNNVDSYEELPLKLGKSKDERQNNSSKNKTEETDSSKEDFKKGVTKISKEKYREDSSRAIDADTSKFWSADTQSKNVFTLAPAPDINEFPEPPDYFFEVTKHPSFEANADLTTPTTKIFDQKFKETVESVEQNIEEDEHVEHDIDTQIEQNKDADLNVEDPFKKPDNESLEFIKTKAIVNNETVEKNSIHKDLNIEQTKKLNYETVFNDTKVYGESTVKGETFDPSPTEKTTTSTTPTLFIATTRKSSLLKELLAEKSTSHIFSNNIETETTKQDKGVITSTVASTTRTDKGEVNNIKITTADTSSEVPITDSQSTTISPNTATTLTANTSSTTTSTTTISAPLQKVNISDQENHVIPLTFGSESTPVQELTRLTTTENLKPLALNTSPKPKHTVEAEVAVDESDATSTTDIVMTSTETPETTTTIFDSMTLLSDGTITPFLEEGTTIFVVENTKEMTDSTTELPPSTEETTALAVETITTESGHRTSKSLENSIVTEQVVKINEKTVENTTKMINTETTVINEIDSTTLNDESTIETKPTHNIIGKLNDTKETITEEVVSTSTVVNKEITNLEGASENVLINITTPKIPESSETTTEVKKTSTEDISESPSTTREVKITTQKEKLQPTTTEYVFLHIENTGPNHTTLLPEILSPNLNYSTTVTLDNEVNKIRQVVLNEHSTSSVESVNSSSTTSTSTSTTTSSTTPEPMLVNISVTTGDDAETSTDNSYSKDDSGGGGGDKGKIAAIAISSVGAVCLVLLAGLLYVMKKRQKRLNYGPRCRPVSLDDYSIDNLSVYNSVRRKGAARLSKRSFGNPAFEDPVAPTHPLNFPALAKFSGNYEDIKAEFEEIPQISARTSELPDGCETKNRYANVIPLPETRVFLKPIDGYPNSDYINANYVTGPKNVKGYYIATQGPMQNTVDDFWRMIWEQQAKVILMLTHLVENGLEKCVDYLPESEVIDCSRLFGDFQIILKKQEVKDKYIISTLQLKNMVSNSWREVTHFWYLGWPEKGVPAEGNSLIAFLIEARSYMKTATIDKRDGINGIQNGGGQNEHNPVVVHCSPGTGRTGVAMACDIAIREFETTRLVDIPKIVYRIRRDRAGAVQTKEQYMFIYRVVSLYATKLTGEALENF